MLFNSTVFLLFFPFVCIICWLIKEVLWRNIFLLTASYYFYMNWEPIYAILLLGCSSISYIASLAIEKRPQNKKIWLYLSIGSELSLLGLFKYADFISDNIQWLFQHLNIQMDVPHLSLLLPVGISFFIFQSVGYIVDVYKGNIKAERNFITYTLFIAFFPQLVAGPIERSCNLLPQFKHIRIPNNKDFNQGISWMLWGYFMKLVLADRCALVADNILNDYELFNGTSLFIASLCFSFQIYGDFCGYSLIAIGAAKIMGFQLMKNFNHPYLSISISDFWRRWHISLSSWFRDYLYIPLGGSHGTSLRTYRNLLITFLISGLWHGANWTFILWGGLHGILLCLERRIGWNRKSVKGVKRAIHIVVTFLIVTFLWIIFRAPNISQAFSIISAIFTDYGTPYSNQMADYAAIIAAISILFAKELTDDSIWRKRLLSSKYVHSCAMALLLAYIVLFGVLNGDQFIYFQF